VRTRAREREPVNVDPGFLSRCLGFCVNFSGVIKGFKASQLLGIICKMSMHLVFKP
jgi:hypothetical protein